MNRWIDYEDVAGEGSNTYECPDCGFVLQLMEGTPEENLYNCCPKCGTRLIKEDKVVELKAWQVTEEYEGYATIVFAETRNKAKYLATQYDETLQECGYAEVRARRVPQVDRYAGDKPYVMDFELDEDRLIMVRDAGFGCLEPNYADCEKCVAKDYCGEYQDYLEDKEDKAT